MTQEQQSPIKSDQDPQTVEGSRTWVHGLLFLATCGTTFYAGGSFFATTSEPFAVKAGLMFSAAIMGILLVHEMGHFIAARLHRVDASLPYFLPVPFPPIGTFGAIIRMRRPPRTRASLLDIGCAGPLAGVVVAIVVCYVGLVLSEVRSLANMEPSQVWQEGNSLLYLMLKNIAHPGMGPGEDVWIHPLAWAGWLGLLVTSLNLLPTGQLDGGHVLYALAGPRIHLRVARTVHVVIFVLGLIGLACHLLVLHPPSLRVIQQAGLAPWIARGTGMLVWLIWTVLLRFVGGQHPPVADSQETLGRGRVVLAWITLLVLVLTFTPVIGSPMEP